MTTKVQDGNTRPKCGYNPLAHLLLEQWLACGTGKYGTETMHKCWSTAVTTNNWVRRGMHVDNLDGQEGGELASNVFVLYILVA